MNAPKKLSCKRCQIRKIKCSRSLPCSNCVQIGTSCEYRDVDVRRRPVSQTYLAALESRLAWYESVLQTLKDSSSNDRDAFLRGITLDDNLSRPFNPPNVKQADSVSESEVHHVHPMALLPGPSGALQFHGPTSMYLDDDSSQVLPPAQQFSTNYSDAWSSLRLGSSLGIDDSLIQSCLRLFFIHEYSRCMFIYREVFLEDYFNHDHGGKYWSYPLVYAVCALGAARSEDANIRSKATLLVKCAQEAIFTYGLTSPNITNVQALLCIAFHELGQGSSSLGWLFSGMAFRMGQELGFHQDPRAWINSDRTIITGIDIEIRRRVYWGCYVADKHISLFLGRPVQLLDSDAAVIPSEPLPYTDFPDGHAWFGLGNIASADSPSPVGERPQLTLALKHTVPLGEILQDAMMSIFSPKSARKPEPAILSALGELNLRLNRWQSELPAQLQWSQWTRKDIALRRYALELHLFYHSTVLSLNRHFLSSAHSFPVNEASEAACTASCDQIVALLRHYRQQHGSIRASLMMIYAVVLTAIILSMTSTRTGAPTRRDPRIAFCMRILQDASAVFELAKEAHSRLAKQLNFAEHNPKSSRNNPNTNTPPIPGAYDTSPTSIQQADELFNELFGAGHDASMTVASPTAMTKDDTAPPIRSSVTESIPELSSVSQHNLDAFSMFMQDDPVDSLHGDFYGWFSRALD